MIGGLAVWGILMIYIVVQNMSTGAKPSALLIALTLLAWVVFFIGKTMNKKGTDASDAHGS